MFKEIQSFGGPSVSGGRLSLKGDMAAKGIKLHRDGTGDKEGGWTKGVAVGGKKPGCAGGLGDGPLDRLSWSSKKRPKFSPRALSALKYLVNFHAQCTCKSNLPFQPLPWEYHGNIPPVFEFI